MVDESSGTRDDTDDRTERSVAESDADVGADANRPDSGGGWGVADRSGDSERGDSVRDERTDDDDRIPLDLSDSSDAADADGVDADDEYTPESNSTPIEPGDPDVESALFVLLGAIAMVLVLVRLVMIPLG
ncbi:hypothetical protein A6E15_13455 [Natrinema saccharevitans]|uniref:DUF7312 domain-containing protein n=1 Tax=Natrinema saccharevitans TaxID=301967 RepID=A0A1S8AZ81_9EURY|nr:hypothetical protein [Natrinema saccharevitans]OLZ41927.1 hypothetical protein A6E15_13455 [Natrinema saccharevitans]